jgi:hypothetical protein
MPNIVVHMTILRSIAAFLLVFTALQHLSCKKEIPANYTLFPVELTAASIAEGVKLSWTKIATSDFADYTVVKSIGDSIDALDNLDLLPQATILTTIKDSKTNKFIDEDLSFGNETTYYRVFARLEGRVLASYNVAVAPSIFPLTVAYENIISNNDKENPLFYLSNGFGDRVCAIYDPKQNKITAKSTFNLAVPFFLRTTLASKNGQNEEIAAIGRGYQIAFNDAKSLAPLGQFSINQNTELYAIGGTNDGFFILITGERVNNVKCISTGTHAILSQSTVNFGFNTYVGSVLVKNPADREFIFRELSSVLDSTDFARFRYNEQGQISEVVTGKIRNPSGSRLVANYSQDGAYCIINNSLLNRSLQVEKKIVDPFGFVYTGFHINPQNDKLYAIQQDLSVSGINSTINIDEYAFPSLTFLREIRPVISARHCFVVKNTLYVFSDFFVQKINL